MFSTMFTQLYSFHASKLMLKFLQARHQQYVNQELSGIQARFRKDRGTRDQIANIHWIIEKAREFQKTTCFCFTDYAKAFDCVYHNNWKILQEMGIPPYLPPEKPVYRSKSKLQPDWNNGMVKNWERSTPNLYIIILLILTSMKGTTWEMLGWKNQKLESRFLGEISITSDMQMIPP